MWPLSETRLCGPGSSGSSGGGIDMPLASRKRHFCRPRGHYRKALEPVAVAMLIQITVYRLNGTVLRRVNGKPTRSMRDGQRTRISYGSSWVVERIIARYSSRLLMLLVTV